MGRPTRRDCLDLTFIFLLTAALIWPLFKVKYLAHWDSIESTFIADARFLSEHWPHVNWQPNWYGGTRFDFVYPPALRYGTAGLVRLYPMLPVRAYHIYTAFFYCLGIAGVYFFVRTAGGSRCGAWLAAAAAALLSPSFLFLTGRLNDSVFGAPQRLWALVRYGEGPHISALAWLPIAIAFSFRAIQQWRPAALACASVCCALVVSNNFYGATSLAIWFPLLLWSLWITHQDRSMLIRAAAVPALAYGLTAFWLTRSYVQITMSNLQLVAEPGNRWSLWVTLAAGGLFVLLSDRYGRGRRERAYSILVWGVFLFFALNVLGNYYLKFRVTGDPSRLVPELDLAMILLAIEGLRWMWGRTWFGAPLVARALCVSLVVVAFSFGIPYLSGPWRSFVRYPNYQDRIEYKIPEWIAQHYPQSRALPTGTVRFWYNAWHDLAQMGGGSEQGLINHAIHLAHNKIIYEDNGGRSTQWLQSFGVDLVIVHAKGAPVIFNDFTTPTQFDGVLNAVYNDGRGTRIFAVPRRFPGLARVVETARHGAVPNIDWRGDTDTLRAYVDVVEKGPETPALHAWEGVDAMRVRAQVREGQSILLFVTYDPAWRAYSAGRLLPTRRDPMGQILIETPPGTHDIRLVFEVPKQQRLGRIMTAMSLLAVAGLVVIGLRRRTERAA